MPLLSCRDASRDYLKAFGYGTFALPKAGIDPLLLLTKRGDRLTPIGPLAATFRPGAVALPQVTRNRTASISGAKSQSFDAGLGLDVLGAAIGALSGSTLGFKAAYKNASEVQFEFGEVFENSAAESELDSYLAAATVDPHLGPTLRELLDRDKVYVLVATIDARQISVKAKSSSGIDLGLEVPVVQQLVGGKISVASAAGQQSVLTYSSTDTPLAIGGQVVRLIFDGTQYRGMKLVSDAPLGIEGEEDVRVAPQELIEL